MRYAINVTPVSGWQTHQSFGESPIALSADGAGSFAIQGEGQADASLTASGYISALAKGQSQADMALTSSAVGKLAIYLSGWADATLSMSGTSIFAVVGKSDLDMALSADGKATMAATGQSTLQMALDADGIGSLVVSGSGLTANMYLGIDAIPYSVKHGERYRSDYAISDVDLALSMTGVSNKYISSPVNAGMVMSATGSAYTIKYGAVNAGLNLLIYSEGRRSKPNYGDVSMALSAEHGMKTTHEHSGFLENTRDRTMRVRPDGDIRVHKENRTV
jgi:hypothetical protein